MKSSKIFVGFFVLASISICFLVFVNEETIVQRQFSHTITLQMEPKVAIPVVENFELAKLPEDQKLLKVRLKPHTKGNGGVIATYMGYFSIFNENGMLEFPRKTDSNTLRVIITKHIIPVIIRGQNIEFFGRKENAAAAYYQFERVEDKEKKEFVWHVSKLETPTSLKTAPDDIIICAKPDEIFVPTGTFSTFGGQNFLLPPLYPTQSLKRNLNALSFLKINRRYFRSLDQNKSYRYQPDRYASLINPI
ncbi:MAG: hypothetical protein UV38_C0002G0214 [candidate division TM6 bacterium GW2011_GWE2_42_60]|nr:MAG: hypothetical protein UV38_C0002G0214 [candidate division TM6 bacterium GW2011_GWE2_42_60]HBY06034.1 hypothetical protein [Candidatus Dependentiae bacterium]